MPDTFLLLTSLTRCGCSNEKVVCHTPINKHPNCVHNTMPICPPVRRLRQFVRQMKSPWSGKNIDRFEWLNPNNNPSNLSGIRSYCVRHLILCAKPLAVRFHMSEMIFELVTFSDAWFTRFAYNRIPKLVSPFINLSSVVEGGAAMWEHATSDWVRFLFSV